MNYVTEKREPKPPLDAAYLEGLRSAAIAKLYAAMQPALRELERLDKLAELLPMLANGTHGYPPNPLPLRRTEIERLETVEPWLTEPVVEQRPARSLAGKKKKGTWGGKRTAGANKKEYAGMTRQDALLKAIGLHPGLRTRQLNAILMAGGLQTDAKDPSNALWVPLAALTKKGLIRTVTDREGKFKTYVLGTDSDDAPGSSRSQLILDILKKEGPATTPDLVEKLQAMNHRFTGGRRPQLLVGWTMNALKSRGTVRQIEPKGDDGLTQWAVA